MARATPAPAELPIGLLALQGDFPTHAAALARFGVPSVQIRTPAELERVRERCAGLVLPGGESTTMWKLLEREGLREPLRALLAEVAGNAARPDAGAGRPPDAGAARSPGSGGGAPRSFPVLATCAGLILCARRVSRPEQPSLEVLDVDVERNAYGRQLASGTHALTPPAASVGPSQGDPARAGGPETWPSSSGLAAAAAAAAAGTFIRAPRIVRVGCAVEVLLFRDADPVLVRQGALLAATFHPEIDDRHPVMAHFVAAARGGSAPDAPAP